MLRVLFVANCEGLYGANRSMLDLAIGLQRLGQEIFFFFPQEESGEGRYILKKELNRHGFTYIFLPYCPSVHSNNKKEIGGRIFRQKKNLKCLSQMKNYIREWKIDIIHTNSLTHTIGAVLSGQTDKPHVWHIREALKEHYGMVYDSSLLYKYALRKTAQVICISDYVRNVYKEILQSAHVITLYDGFDVEYYIMDGVYRKCPSVYNILICGVICEGKGQLDAVRAMEQLIHRYNVKNVHLQIVGGGAGAYFKQIKSFINKEKIDNYVDILPFQVDLRELREKTDIALVCSRGEAFGRVTVESMLSENLVIGADSAGTAEIIKDGIVGYLYETGNVVDLCEKIYHVITHWSEQAVIIKRAKAYAKKKYDVNCYAERMLHIYKRLL